MNRLLTIIAAALLVGGCGDDGTDPSDDSDFGTVLTTISAVADGGGATEFRGELSVQATLAGGVLAFAAADNRGGDALQLNVSIPNAAVGTFSTGGSQPTTLVYSEGLGASLQSWASALSGGTGSIRITHFTSTHVAGEFVTVPVRAAAGGARTITGGTFDLKLGSTTY